MAAKVQIVTDSTAYLSAEEAARYGVHVIPLKVIFGVDAYDEGIDISNDDFYRRIMSSHTVPTTSQPSIREFTRIYSEMAASGRPVLSLHISSRLSGAVSSARVARGELPQADIEVVDSLSLALRLLVPPAARAAAAGMPLGELKEYIERLNKALHAVGVLETLEYLWRGGRIGGAKALLGTMLRIKPVLAFEGGELKVVAKPRTVHKAIASLLEIIGDRVDGDSPIHAMVVHSHNSEAALGLKGEIEAKFNCVELGVVELGPVLGTHVGPGFFGLGFYSERDWKPRY